MRILRLAARSFRNLEPFDLSLDAQFVVFHGRNAQGKTNALEAVYLLATLKALRGRRLKELIGWGAQQAAILGQVRCGDRQRQYRVDLQPTGRTALLDGKKANDLGEYFDGIRAIAFTPQDGRIVAGEPAHRRTWLDRAAFTATPAHLDVVRFYRRCLEQKAAALRASAPDGALLDAIDDQVARAGADLVTRRVALLAELQPHVRALHHDIAGGGADVTLRYQTAATGDSPAERTESLRRRLEEARSNELRRGITLVGPQTDDVTVKLDGRSARTFGSRGQVRSLVLALKLAELVAARERGDVPLFLLDDVSSELDRVRTRRLVGALGDLGAQVLATTTDPEHMDTLPEEETLRIPIEAGRAGTLDPPASNAEDPEL